MARTTPASADRCRKRRKGGARCEGGTTESGHTGKEEQEEGECGVRGDQLEEDENEFTGDGGCEVEIDGKGHCHQEQSRNKTQTMNKKTR